MQFFSIIPQQGWKIGTKLSANNVKEKEVIWYSNMVGWYENSHMGEEIVYTCMCMYKYTYALNMYLCAHICIIVYNSEWNI